MKKIIFLISIVFLLPICLVSAQQSIEITIEANKIEVREGEQLEVVVKLKNAGNNTINFNSFNLPGVNNFEEVKSSKSTQVKIINGATMGISQIVTTLTAKEAGKYKIGPVLIHLDDGFGKIQKIESNFLEIKVLPKEKNILSPLSSGNGKNEQKNDKNYFFNSKFFVILLILTGLAGVFYLKNKNNKIEDDKEIISQAMIKNNFIVPAPEDNNFFIKVKDNLLCFIGQVYQIEAANLTTGEIVNEIEKKQPAHYKEIKKILEICDYGQFAKSNKDKKSVLNLIKIIME